MQADARQAALRQCQQAMAAPEWDPQDWEWRPTWMSPALPLQPQAALLLQPRAALAPQPQAALSPQPQATLPQEPQGALQLQPPSSLAADSPSHVLSPELKSGETDPGEVDSAASAAERVDEVPLPEVAEGTESSGGHQVQQAAPVLQATSIKPAAMGVSAAREVATAAAEGDGDVAMLAELANALADLDAPQHTLRALRDPVRLAAYDAAIRSALKRHPPGVTHACACQGEL